jgi:CubicO group peptidase (beta-lactamase class C family)
MNGQIAHLLKRGGSLLLGLLVGLAMHGGAQALSLPTGLYKPEWVLPQASIAASATPVGLAQGPKVDLGQTLYRHPSGTGTLNELLAQGKVQSYLVLHNGQVVYEHHASPADATAPHQSFSMMKQLLGLLVGIAIDERKIASVDDPLQRYVPGLQRTAFAGVTFRQALHMATGVAYDEDSERVQLFVKAALNRASWGRLGAPVAEQLLSTERKRDAEPGKRYQYASITTQVIQLALEAATGEPVQQYLQSRLWQPLNMPDAAQLLTDGRGEAYTLCCLHATPASYARIGQMMAQGGRWNGRQVVPARWVQWSTTFTDPTVWRAKDVPRTAKRMNLFGFGYHWWPLEGDRGDFTALGIRGQSIYVSPRQNVVVVRLSDDDTPGAHAEEAVMMARAIADRLSPLK